MRVTECLKLNCCLHADTDEDISLCNCVHGVYDTRTHKLCVMRGYDVFKLIEHDVQFEKNHPALYTHLNDQYTKYTQNNLYL